MNLITEYQNDVDTTKAEKLDSFLVFQPPRQIYSFYRDSTARGTETVRPNMAKDSASKTNELFNIKALI